MSAGDDLFARHRPAATGGPGPTDHLDDLEHLTVPGNRADDDGVRDRTADADGADRAAQPDATSPPVTSPSPVDASSSRPDADPDPDATTRIQPVGDDPDPDATTRIQPVGDDHDDRGIAPLPGPPATVASTGPTSLAARRNGHADRASIDETWDTGTIRRWDGGEPDGEPAGPTAPLRRPAQLDDREEVTVERESGGSRWYEVPVMIITALTLAFLLRTFVVQVFYIPSGSMIPTLEVNDRIAVEKISYLTREPARGEVIVFAGDDPLAGVAQESTADRVLTGVGQFLGVVPVDAKDFVKRVIGLPGDQVSITDGRVSVNGVELDEPYARLDNDNGDWEVPPGMLFVMGDNRANSGDSRSTLGYIPEDDVVGRAVMVIWPFDRAGSIPGEAHDVAVDAGS